MEEIQLRTTNCIENIKEKDDLITKLITKNELLVSSNKEMWSKYRNCLMENKSLLNDYKNERTKILEYIQMKNIASKQSSEVPIVTKQKEEMNNIKKEEHIIKNDKKDKLQDNKAKNENNIRKTELIEKEYTSIKPDNKEDKPININKTSLPIDVEENKGKQNENYKIVDIMADKNKGDKTVKKPQNEIFVLDNTEEAKTKKEMGFIYRNTRPMQSINEEVKPTKTTPEIFFGK